MFQLAPPGVFHVTMTLETLAVKGGTIGRGMASNLAESNDFHATLGIFYMLQISTWGRWLYFLSEGRCAEDIFRPEKSDGFGRVWTRELGYQRPARYL